MLRRLLRQHIALRAMVLAAIGPVLGFVSLLIVFPFVVLAFLLGSRLYLALYMMGGVPSAATTAVVIFLERRSLSKFLVYLASFVTGGLTSLAWFACLDVITQAHDPLPGMLALPGACAGALLASVNLRILAEEAGEYRSRVNDNEVDGIA